jgi:acyl-coenzyme A synthetase/AMP-(fatty) acid ligase
MIKPLRHLFATPVAASGINGVIAFDGNNSTRLADLWNRVSAWEAALANVDGKLVALYQRDTIEFLAALFALWRAGKQALVPANNLPASCQQLAELTSYFAGEFAIPGVINPSFDGIDPDLTSIDLPNAQTCALVLFTSGSTSQPIPIAKNFAQLEAELSALESLSGGSIADAHISSTVSHNHIYGLLFRLLRPLCSASPFVRYERDYWAE